jgi:ribosomal protein S18 acetylase RimI-like enzyme
MPRLLLAEPFAPDKLPIVADFHCGNDAWSEAIAAWIKGDVQEPASALRSMAERQTKVWLYFTPDTKELVGYGSLGLTRRRWPGPKDEWMNLAILPAIGIHSRFQGEPKNDPPKFSRQILEDLIAKARLTPCELLILDVHEDNHKAIKLYEKLHFHSLSYKHDRLLRMYHKLR